MASYILAITGASGAVYGLKLADELLKRGDDVELVISPPGFLILKDELGLDFGDRAVPAVLKEYMGGRWGSTEGGILHYHDPDDLTSPLASGSALVRKMIICPSSVGTIARIAAGVSGNLIERAADCILKERGTLVLVPRETPLNSIHLENMLKLSRAGAVILPAMPGFYSRPTTVEEMIDFVAGKILDILGIENTLYRRWKG